MKLPVRPVRSPVAIDGANAPRVFCDANIFDGIALCAAVSRLKWLCSTMRRVAPGGSAPILARVCAMRPIPRSSTAPQ